jgi:hypothetical protein
VNLFSNDWYEWGAYYAAETRYIPFQVSSMASTPIGILCGDASDGLIHKLVRGGADESKYGAIAPMVRSVGVDRGDPGIYKRCKSLTFKFSAPQTHTGTTFSITIKYSDDGGSTWSTTRTVSATVASGLKQYVVKEFNFGRYLTRQWQIDFTTSSDIGLGPVIEDFEYMI